FLAASSGSLGAGSGFPAFLAFVCPVARGGSASMATPPARTPTSSTAVAILSLVNNMVFNTPSVRAATLAETSPAGAARPAPNRIAALTVDPTNGDGTHADAAP